MKPVVERTMHGVIAADVVQGPFAFDPVSPGPHLEPGVHSIGTLRPDSGISSTISVYMTRGAS